MKKANKMLWIMLLTASMSFNLLGCSKGKKVSDGSLENPTPTIELQITNTPIPEPTATDVPTPTLEPTIEPTEVPTPTEVPESTTTPTSTPTPIPTNTPTPEPTATSTPIPTPTNTPTPSPTNTPVPTVTPRPTSTPTPTPIPKVTVTVVENTPTPKPTKKPKATSTPTPEPTNTPKPTKKPKATPTPEIEGKIAINFSDDMNQNEKDKIMSDGLVKVSRLIEAYNDIIEYGDLFEHCLQHDVEHLSMLTIETAMAVLLDCYMNDTEPIIWGPKGDVIIQQKYTVQATLAVYYDNYVNNNGSYYNILEWLRSQESEEEIIKMCMDPKSTNTSDRLLIDAIACANFLKNCESITGEKIYEYKNLLVNGIPSSYAIQLNCDGDKNLLMIFDNYGNLLNLVPKNDKNFESKYIITTFDYLNHIFVE
ncbi:MAG: PT domain-containing protein [Lachnospiraceae bacterium]|nr:PT domain-containing protein [Lachnospiraceae bacterium]